MLFNSKFKEKLDSYESRLLILERRTDRQESAISRLKSQLEINSRLKNPNIPSKKEFQPSPAKLVDRRVETIEPSYPSCNDILLQNAVIASSYSSNDSYSPSCNSSSYDSSSSSCDSSYSSSDY